jgi:hypothetical protein
MLAGFVRHVHARLDYFCGLVRGSRNKYLQDYMEESKLIKKALMNSPRHASISVMEARMTRCTHV